MATINMDVMGHLPDIGDEHKGAGEFVGTRGQKKPIEGFSIISLHQEGRLGVRYRASIRNAGESAWKQDGQLAGERGKRSVIEGLQIELYGKDLALYDIEYMAHVAEIGDTRWYANGEHCGTAGHAIEGFAVRIVARAPNLISLVSQARANSGKHLVITAPAPDRTVQVSASTGEETQLWDRRPVKAGSGFVLISKAWPGLCLAHAGGDKPIVLRDVRLIDGDDRCVWRDDNVPGEFNAINTWTNWEFKLNMRGNPPYADQGTDLLLYHWAGGARNELWRATRRHYEVVSGFDAQALNQVAGSIYRSCYPAIFSGRLPIGDGGLLSVGYDMFQQPEFFLERPPELRGALQRAALLQQAHIEQLGLTVDQVLDNATLTALVRDFKLSVELQDQTVVHLHATLVLGVAIRPSANRKLGLKLMLADLQLSDQTWLEQPLKACFIPLLLELLNNEILRNIDIPALEFDDLRLAMPAVAVRTPFALISTTRLPDVPSTPPDGAWPRDSVFAAIDAPLLGAVAMTALARVAPHDEWRNSVFIATSASYGVRFNSVRFDLQPGGNRYHVQIQAYAYANLSIDVGITTLSLEPGTHTDIGATAAVEIDQQGQIKVRLESVDPVLLYWSLGLPWWAKVAESSITSMFSVFSTAVANAIAQCLRNASFDVYKLPEINASIAGKEFAITFERAELGSTTDNQGKPLLLATTVPSVRLA